MYNFAPEIKKRRNGAWVYVLFLGTQVGNDLPPQNGTQRYK